MRGIESVILRLTLALFATAATCQDTPQPNPTATSCEVEGAQQAILRFRAMSAAGELLSDEGRALLTGELARNSRASWGTQPLPVRLICLPDGGVVARMPATAGAADGYLYLRKAAGKWSIHAARALALPAFVNQLVRDLAGRTVRTSAEEAMYQELLLVTLPDDELAAWRREHAADLNRLRDLASTGGGVSRRINPDRAASPEVNQLLDRLHLTSAEARNGLTTVVIGGIMDNSVGFFHAADPALLPTISPSEYIWIEPVGENWYLFKTT